MRTATQITTKLRALKSAQRRTHARLKTHQAAFLKAHDQAAALAAQIVVLRDRMTPAEVEAAGATPDATVATETIFTTFHTEAATTAAHQAATWLHGKKPSSIKHQVSSIR